MNDSLQINEIKSSSRRARDEKGFVLFIDMCVIDRQHEDKRFECVYRVCNPESGEQLSLSTKLSDHDASMDTLSDIWPAAEWYEREAFEMFGISFRGNKNLSRLLTPSDFEGHPLRKDFSG